MNRWLKKRSSHSPFFFHNASCQSRAESPNTVDVNNAYPHARQEYRKGNLIFKKRGEFLQEKCILFNCGNKIIIFFVKIDEHRNKIILLVLDKYIAEIEKLFDILSGLPKSHFLGQRNI